MLKKLKKLYSIIRKRRDVIVSDWGAVRLLAGVFEYLKMHSCILRLGQSETFGGSI
jgi:hypothetical protein